MQEKSRFKKNLGEIMIDSGLNQHDENECLVKTENAIEDKINSKINLGI